MVNSSPTNVSSNKHKIQARCPFELDTVTRKKQRPWHFQMINKKSKGMDKIYQLSGKLGSKYP